MLNIISKSGISNYTSGPQKVAKNLMKGLDRIGYPYVLNGALDSCKRLWIHDDTDALKELTNIPNNIQIVVGPNLYVLPRHIPSSIDLSRALYITPSRWNTDFWISEGFDMCPMDYWATGIDTYAYKPTNCLKKYVLIYFKERLPQELVEAERILKNKNIPYKTIRYGKYFEEEYKNTLMGAKYVLWIGRQESQGIALQEALAMNIPILVWDVKNIGHWLTKKKYMSLFTQREANYDKATAAPFFDHRCGIIFQEQNELSKHILMMEQAWKTFIPREYVLENLSLEGQARAFINLYNTHYHLTYEEGLKENLLNTKKWGNASLRYYTYVRLKDFIKNMRNYL